MDGFDGKTRDVPACVRGFPREEERRAVAYELHDGLTQYVLPVLSQSKETETD